VSSADPLAWLAVAREDALAAQRLLDDEPQCAPAAYHVQQAAEKAIKARLVQLRLGFPRGGGAGHDLSIPVGLLPATDPIRSEAARLIDLTPWSFAWRYPHDDPATAEPTPSPARIAADLATVMILVDRIARLEAEGHDTNG
jgi:HEPN domain-containing protein